MTISYQVFKIIKKDFLKKSTDYYASGNDWEEETLFTLEYHGSFPNEQKAIQHLFEIKANDDSEGNYTILPTYTI